MRTIKEFIRVDHKFEVCDSTSQHFVASSTTEKSNARSVIHFGLFFIHKKKIFTYDVCIYNVHPGIRNPNVGASERVFEQDKLYSVSNDATLTTRPIFHLPKSSAKIPMDTVD